MAIDVVIFVSIYMPESPLFDRTPKKGVKFYLLKNFLLSSQELHVHNKKKV